MKVFEQGGAALLQRVKICGFVVGRAGLPAAIKNADPLKGQRTYRRLVGAALVALLPIVDASPDKTDPTGRGGVERFLP
jgi:hypothetical protein